MYLIGENSAKFPWSIPKDFPKNALSDENMKKFISFIDSYNEEFKFTKVEKLIFIMIRILLPGLGKLGHYFIRKAKFAAF